ncbi:hypothetical protein BJX63DRAFT_434814 [Aspergillus granulosus]|uniref:Uncharacterized protein n=1 Tax=Aspergillus granulosus TaxID=176169 RepID=A0ABR4H345_9EURO
MTNSVANKKENEEADSFKGSFFVPENREEWDNIVKGAKISKMTINSILKMGSGSNVLKKQFLMLKVLWLPRREPSYLINKCLAMYGLDTYWQEAKQALDNSGEFRNYISVLEGLHHLRDLNENHPDWPGAFVNVLELQQECADQARQCFESPRKIPRRSERISDHVFSSRVDPETNDQAGEAGEAEDENIVNAALLSFLRRVAVIAGVPASCWTFKRVFFHPLFAATGYRTITDGALRTQIDRVIRAILEVKRGKRDHSHDKIRMQETAELVGWILHTQGDIRFLNDHHLLISQDGTEIFLTFAKKDPGYVDYLQGNANADSFLAIQTIGPYNIFSSRHMRFLARVTASVVLAMAATEGL